MKEENITTGNHDPSRFPSSEKAREMLNSNNCLSCEKRKKTGHTCGIINQEKGYGMMDALEDHALNKQWKEPKEKSWSERFDEEFPKMYKYGDHGLQFETDIGKLHGQIKLFISTLLQEQKQEFEEEKMINHLAWKKTLEEMVENEKRSSYRHNWGRVESPEDALINSALDTIKKRIEDL